NALSGYLDLLLMELRGPLTDAQRADLQRMQRSQRHLTSLINDVLNFATLDVGHTEFTIAPVNVGDVVRDVEELVSPQCAAKQIHCELEIPSPGPTAAADRERVAQILLNVLANAVKYTDPGGRIHASCGATAQAVRVVVTDSGRGIPRDQLERIFDPFVQVERRLTSAAGDGGVGLGLAISRSLAEGMNGSLTVESELGVGSTFTLLLPLLRPPAT
nr:HAMP domain-containing histidine kinase [Gemmatimonadaceae bacterium]